MKKFYTEEFKKMTVELSYSSDKQISKICKNLGISNLIFKNNFEQVYNGKCCILS